MDRDRKTLETFCPAQKIEGNEGKRVVRCTYGGNEGKVCPYRGRTYLVCSDGRDAKRWAKFAETIRYDNH